MSEHEPRQQDPDVRGGETARPGDRPSLPAEVLLDRWSALPNADPHHLRDDLDEFLDNDALDVST